MLLSYNLGELERLAIALARCALLVVSVLNEIKFKQTLLTLIRRLSANFEFKAFVFLESSGARCCYYSASKEHALAGSLRVGAQLLDALVSVATTRQCERTRWRYNIEPLLPLR